MRTHVSRQLTSTRTRIMCNSRFRHDTDQYSFESIIDALLYVMLYGLQSVVTVLILRFTYSLRLCLSRDVIYARETTVSAMETNAKSGSVILVSRPGGRQLKCTF